MEKEEIGKLIKIRIQNDLDYFGGKMPEKFAVAWQGYLTGLVEWNVIDRNIYGELLKLLPKVSEPDPIESILMGRE